MKKKILILICVVILILAFLIFLLLNGIIIPTKLEAEKYEIKGIDVSEYQGTIDWKKIENQGINFAFIKATEGSKSKDNCFDFNYKEIKNTNLLLGIYHFFSFESSGYEQYVNYKNVVGKIEDDDDIFLPIIDVEYYGKYKRNNVHKENFKKELQEMLGELEKTYRIKPFIYTTTAFYNDYIKNEFKNYDIWIRNIYQKPVLEENREWKFWQYTGKGRLNGYEGEEWFIDLNVFNGTKENFDNYIKSKKEEKRMNFNKEKIEEKLKEESTVTNIYKALITNIENNILILKTEEGETLKIILEDETKVFNARTNENYKIENIKVNDKVNLENILKKDGIITLTDKTKVLIVRDIHGEELKQELLNSEVDFRVEYIIEKGNNYILKGEITDWYYITDYNLAERFEIEVLVNNNTQILGITGKTKEQLKYLYGNTIYITFDKNELKKGKLVAINIEVMGC